MAKSALEEIILKIFQDQKAGPTIPQSLVGVCMEKDSIAIAYLNGTKPGEITVVDHAFCKSEDPELRQKTLNEFVLKNNLYDQPCSVLLDPQKYHLGLIESPNVDPAERKAAVKWAVSEFVTVSPEQCEVDAIELPLVRASDNKKMAYAAIVEKDIIEEIQHMIQSSGLELRYIDIQEMGLRNLILLHPEYKQSSLLVRVDHTGGNVIITLEDELCISRRLDVNLNDFIVDENYLSREINEDNDALDNLTIDVQRSMDYCSSMFRNCPADSIYITSAELDENVIEKYLDRNLELSVKTLDIDKLIKYKEQATEKQRKESIMGVCAALYNLDTQGAA